jgi:hypothetical protein
VGKPSDRVTEPNGFQRLSQHAKRHCHTQAEHSPAEQNARLQTQQGPRDDRTRQFGCAHTRRTGLALPTVQGLLQLTMADFDTPARAIQIARHRPWQAMRIQRVGQQVDTPSPILQDDQSQTERGLMAVFLGPQMDMFRLAKMLYVLASAFHQQREVGAAPNQQGHAQGT